MVPKVYGKKSRAVIAADFCTLFSSSPDIKEATKIVDLPVIAVRKEADVLNPKSSNVKAERARSESYAPGGQAKGLEFLGFDEQKSCKNVEEEEKAKGNHIGVEDATTMSEDITRALGDLEIRDTSAKRMNKAQKAISQPTVPQIPPQPTAVPASTTTYISPILACKSVSPQIEDFALWLTARTPHLTLCKIGEGSYGEVYRATDKAFSSSSSSAPSSASTAILKLIPLRAQRGANSRSLTPIVAAATELRLLVRMQRVPGFVEYRGACVLRGRMPAPMVRLWRAYRNTSGRTVESRDPGRKGAWGEGQLWLVIEMGDAGVSLEEVVKRKGEGPGGAGVVEDGLDRQEALMGLLREGLSVRHVWDIFWQIVAALAKAELSAQFEHRDLHLGNICVKQRLGSSPTDAASAAPGFPHPSTLTGLEATLIDYTLSRATLPSVKDAKGTLCYDFKADKQLLAGEGDPQYDIYRAMARTLGQRDAAEFVPSTNVLWLGYVLRLLLEKCKGRTGRGASHEDKMWAAVEKRMKGVLKELQERTSVEKLDTEEGGPSSAGDLFDLGIHSGWVSIEDLSL